jgi:hypothetical protein
VKAKTKPTKRSRPLSGDLERRKLQPLYHAAFLENTAVLKIVKEKLVDAVKLEARVGDLEISRSEACLKLSDLEDTVNGNEGKKIVGLGAQIRALGEIFKHYWDGAKLYILGLSGLVLILVALHMVEVGTALAK